MIQQIIRLKKINGSVSLECQVKYLFMMIQVVENLQVSFLLFIICQLARSKNIGQLVGFLYSFCSQNFNILEYISKNLPILSILTWIRTAEEKKYHNINAPIVDIKVVLNASSENLNKRQVFPTPLSPINRSLNKQSYAFFAILTPTYSSKQQ